MAVIKMTVGCVGISGRDYWLTAALTVDTVTRHVLMKLADKRELQLERGFRDWTKTSE